MHCSHILPTNLSLHSHWPVTLLQTSDFEPIGSHKQDRQFPIAGLPK